MVTRRDRLPSQSDQLKSELITPFNWIALVDRFLRVRVKRFLALQTHLQRLAFGYFFSYYCFLRLFFYFSFAWLAPNTEYAALLSSDVFHAFSVCPGTSRRPVGFSFCSSPPRQALCSIIFSFLPVISAISGDRLEGKW